MRATLEQLKAMNNGELLYHWARCRFPFEHAKCGACLTGHVSQTFCSTVKEHNALHLAVSVFHLTPGGFDAELVRTHLEELYALRLFYDHLYAPAPSEQSVAAEEVAARTVEVGEKAGKEGKIDFGS